MRSLALRLSGALFVLLLILALGATAWLSQRHGISWRWGGAISQELSEPSKRLLERLQAPVSVHAFVPPGHLLQAHLQELLGRYAAQRHDFRFELINPDSRPDLVRQLGVEQAGELVLQYGERSERVKVPTESHVSAALERLLREQDQFIAFLNGHGERSLLGEANHDLGAFGKVLRQKGYRLQPLSLARLPKVPDNAALLVLAAPQTEPLPIELERLQAYVARGGNLLWLGEPEPQAQLTELAQLIGLQWQPGVAVDPVALASLGGDDPRLVLVDHYPAHPATERLKAPTLFPQAATMLVEAGEWEAAALVLADDGQYRVEDFRPGQPLTAPAATPPLALGLSLSRQLNDTRQRVVVMGDGDFLSNSYLGNGANLQLGLNLVDWLTESELFLDSFARAAPDQTLALSQAAVLGIGFGFLLVLPGLCFGLAGWRWWRRRSG
jgi:ABC-type uncharacterized transport system involved in gliding motility auxiliary subunit